MFILRARDTGAWRLAQVDLLETDPHAALNFGQYIVRWWTPSLTDRKNRILRECRFAPDVRTINGDDGYGQRHPIKSAKIELALKSDKTIRWMSDAVNLTEDRIVGPFDFETVRSSVDHDNKRQATSEYERVPQFAWDSLESRGMEMNVRVSDIHSKVPDPEAF
jgi:hypothetical protein